MELKILDDLERQVTKLLELYGAVKQEHDDLVLQVKRLEAEKQNLIQNETRLIGELEELQSNSRNREKETALRAKVEELMSRLEQF